MTLKANQTKAANSRFAKAERRASMTVKCYFQALYI